ncbi:hypothetical protein ACWDA3_40380 [Nonomuraea rubra]
MIKGTLRVVLISALVMAGLAITTQPAAAGGCGSPGCGGEVSNNTSRYIQIANCWYESDGYWYQEGDHLSCTGAPVRIGNVPDARIGLAPGDWSSEGQYSAYYDTDAVKFPGGCRTTYHWWGTLQSVEDRRNKPALWVRIFDPEHIYIDNITCP